MLNDFGLQQVERPGVSVPTHFRPSERSIWLSELEATLDQAMTILARLEHDCLTTAESNHLRARLATIRSEVDEMRRGRLRKFRLVAPTDTE